MKEFYYLYVASVQYDYMELFELHLHYLSHLGFFALFCQKPINKIQRKCALNLYIMFIIHDVCRCLLFSLHRDDIILHTERLLAIREANDLSTSRNPKLDTCCLLSFFMPSANVGKFKLSCFVPVLVCSAVIPFFLFFIWVLLCS